VLIKSVNQLTENLSRIRVSVNHKNNDKICDKIMPKVLLKEMATKPKTDKINENINKSKLNSMMSTSKSSLKSDVNEKMKSKQEKNCETVCKSSLEKVKSKSYKTFEIINKTRLNSMNSNSSTSHSSFKSVSDEKIRCDLFLIQCVYSLINKFKSDSTNGWKLVSEKMFGLGFESLTEEKCKKQFYVCISKYVEVLEYSKSFQNACHIYQSFANLNKLDLRPFLSPKTYRKVIKLKEKFSLKVDSNESKVKTSIQPQINQKQVSNAVSKQENFFNKADEKVTKIMDKKTITETPVVKVEKNSSSHRKQTSDIKSSEKVKNKPKINNNNSKRDNNIVITLENDPKKSKTERKVELKFNNSCDSQQNKQNDDMMTTAVQKCIEEDMKSYSSKESIRISDKSEQNKIFIEDLIRDSELAQKVKNLSDYFITKELFISDPSIAWQMVSFEMVFKCNYENFSPEYCQYRFNELIKRYVQVLQTLRNPQMARNQFHSFDIINCIDLSLFMDPIFYQLIVNLKRKLGFSEDIVNEKPSAVPQTSQSLTFVEPKKGKVLVQNKFLSENQLKIKDYIRIVNQKSNNSTKNKRQNFSKKQKFAHSKFDKELLNLIKTGKIDDRFGLFLFTSIFILINYHIISEVYKL
jgi:hypothetical protein